MPRAPPAGAASISRSCFDVPTKKPRRPEPPGLRVLLDEVVSAWRMDRLGADAPFGVARPERAWSDGPGGRAWVYGSLEPVHRVTSFREQEKRAGLRWTHAVRESFEVSFGNGE